MLFLMNPPQNLRHHSRRLSFLRCILDELRELAASSFARQGADQVRSHDLRFAELSKCSSEVRFGHVRDDLPDCSCLASLVQGRGKNGRMEDNTLVESSFSATVKAQFEKVAIPSRCFALPESEYQSWSPAHCSAGATMAPDGFR